MSQDEAMRLYIVESDRQIRVYGMTPDAPSARPALENGSTTPSQQPRGLAAIPLLCAAASESRQAYLRRLANTRPEQAWWQRQEPLCATPGSILALPETLVIQLAALLEFVSLSAEGSFLPAPVVQSFLWPLHNCLLAEWMGVILVYTAWTAGLDLLSTLLWGSRRTGLSLLGVWKDQVSFGAQSVSTLTESHQPLSARLVGLVMLPLTALVGLASMPPPVVWASLLYIVLLAGTWWYWMMVLPALAAGLLGMAVVAGNCFALIELAGV